MTIIKELATMARDAIRSAEVAALRAIRPAPVPHAEERSLLDQLAQAIAARDAAEAECRELKSALFSSRSALANVREQYAERSQLAAKSAADAESTCHALVEIGLVVDQALAIAQGKVAADAELSGQDHALVSAIRALRIQRHELVETVQALRAEDVDRKNLRRQLAEMTTLAEQRLAHANQLQPTLDDLRRQRDALLSTVNEVFAAFSVTNVIELAATVHELRRDAENWRALAQHSGPAHDAVHAAEQALSGLHRALHEGLGHPSKGVKT